MSSKTRAKNARLTDLDKYAIRGMLMSGLSKENMHAVLKLHDESKILDNFLEVIEKQKQYNQELQIAVYKELVENGVSSYVAESVSNKMVMFTPRKPGLSIEIEAHELYQNAIQEIKDSDLMVTRSQSGAAISTMNKSLGAKEAEKILSSPMAKTSGHINKNNPDVFMVPVKGVKSNGK